ncbi:uncharacterized protein LOC115407062 [Salarias fasciatus]|uniref:uncharacterized protein LOC115407062 n=1 Tax=Salarias fasciatus TaxID=181472 RepID=UPI0011765C43|nr:uncharacterized protein LOC115407062 [Salarias fasciatus]
MFEHKEFIFWFRIISGHKPEFLGGTYGFDYEGVHQSPHFTTKQEPGTFILYINQTQISDTGLYYCIRTETLQMTFRRRVFLKIEGPQSAISNIIQARPSDEVLPGESVCFNNFFRKVTVSDDGTYYCAVAACGEVMFGNGAKVEDSNTRALNNTEIALCILCVALAASLTVSICLIWKIKKKNSDSGAEPTSSDQQREEASLTYSAPTFSKRKVTKEERGNTPSPQKETIYSDVRFHH